MTSDINPETGLPEAPEGHRWKIQPKQHYEFPGYGAWQAIDDPKILVIRLQRRGEEDNLEPVYSRFRHRIIRHVVNGKREVWTDLGDTEELKGNHSVAAVNAAYRILKRFAVAQDRAKLIGTYPPKSLVKEES